VIEPLVELQGVVKDYDGLRVLSGIDARIEEGQSVAIVGPSGSGKSTLLNLIGTLDTPTAGTVRFKSRDLSSLSENDRARLRNQDIGFVFQFHHLLPQCSVLENALLPTMINVNATDVVERATRLLERVGLADKLNQLPGALSGGERQRAAVVRALINRPSLLLADEPTGSLNAEAADALAELLLELNREEGMTLVVVTHSPAVAQRMGRILELREGALVTSPAAHA
jgi:ABC-type lipoprotein export system ATPase subunit